MKNKFILDPMWITKGDTLDSEYFDYILLDACMKYKKEIEELNINRFDEIIFHILNLNTLVINGNLFSPRLKKISKTPVRLSEIRENLKKLYKLDTETAEVFRNANYVFLNVILDYLNIQMEVLEKIRIFNLNKKVHLEKDIFIVVNEKRSKIYSIWKLSVDLRKNFGYSFSKEEEIKIDKLDEDSLVDRVKALNNPKLKKVKSSNVVYIMLKSKQDKDLVAMVVKDTLVLNKRLAKGKDFMSDIISDLYLMLWYDKVMPFTLDEWAQV